MNKTAKELAQEILDSGLTQQEVAEKIGTTQATISKLVRGVITDVGYATGKQLEALHRTKMRRRTAEKLV